MRILNLIFLEESSYGGGEEMEWLNDTISQIQEAMKAEKIPPYDADLHNSLLFKDKLGMTSYYKVLVFDATFDEDIRKQIKDFMLKNDWFDFYAFYAPDSKIWHPERHEEVLVIESLRDLEAREMIKEGDAKGFFEKLAEQIDHGKEFSEIRKYP